jgi:hypothetical protein
MELRYECNAVHSAVTPATATLRACLIQQAAPDMKALFCHVHCCRRRCCHPSNAAAQSRCILQVKFEYACSIRATGTLNLGCCAMCTHNEHSTQGYNVFVQHHTHIAKQQMRGQHSICMITYCFEITSWMCCDTKRAFVIDVSCTRHAASKSATQNQPCIYSISHATLRVAAITRQQRTLAWSLHSLYHSLDKFVTQQHTTARTHNRSHTARAHTSPHNNSRSTSGQHQPQRLHPHNFNTNSNVSTRP